MGNHTLGVTIGRKPTTLIGKPILMYPQPHPPELLEHYRMVWTGHRFRTEINTALGLIRMVLCTPEGILPEPEGRADV